MYFKLCNDFFSQNYESMKKNRAQNITVEKVSKSMLMNGNLDEYKSKSWYIFEYFQFTRF